MNDRGALAGARALLFVLVSLLAPPLVGCGGEPPPKSADNGDGAFEAAVAAEKERDAKKEDEKKKPETAAPKPKGALLAAPFTWEQIRAATKNGRTYRYRVEVPGKPPRERLITFTKVDATGAEIFAGGEAPRRIGWPALQKDAEFPKDRVKVREESVKLPGGKFDCVVYELKGEAGELWTYYFAKSLPGAPVLFFTEQDGQRLKTTTLLQHIPGKDS